MFWKSSLFKYFQLGVENWEFYIKQDREQK